MGWKFMKGLESLSFFFWVVILEGFLKVFKGFDEEGFWYL
jgi:hypothetical protein